MTGYDPTIPYVGPASWPVFVLVLVPHWRLFNYAAYLHDLFFAKGGTREDMLMANRIFKTMIMAVAKTESEKRWARRYGRLVDSYSEYFFTFRGRLDNNLLTNSEMP